MFQQRITNYFKSKTRNSEEEQKEERSWSNEQSNSTGKRKSSSQNSSDDDTRPVGLKKRHRRIVSDSSEDEHGSNSKCESQKTLQQSNEVSNKQPKQQKANKSKESTIPAPSNGLPLLPLKNKRESKTLASTSKTDSHNVNDSNEHSSPVKATFQEPTDDTLKPDSNISDDGFNYDPSKANYHPIKDAFWKYGESVPYLALARTFEVIEAHSARLKIIDILANYMRSVILLNPGDLLPSVYLCLNKLAPAFEGVELGIAETTLMRAIADGTGRSLAHIKADVTKFGDLGIVAEKSRIKQNTMFHSANLTVPGVFKKLKEIAKMSGKTAVRLKTSKIQALLVACCHSEARYLIRSLSGKLRVGLAEQSVLQSLAVACTKTPPGQEYPPALLDRTTEQSNFNYKHNLDEASLLIKTAFCECPDYGKIIGVILDTGVDTLPKFCGLKPGIPLKPMLAHPTKGVQEVLERFEGHEFTCEWKYDGERAQIHLAENGEKFIFSRNQENNTGKYPDIINHLDKFIGSNVSSFIMDCEAVAWDTEEKKILPFQVLSTRKRKGVMENDIKVHVCLFAFDLLFFNGEPLIKRPFQERRQILHENFIVQEGKFHFATSMDTGVLDEVQGFLEDSIQGQCEGLMVKTLKEDATYEIAKRSRNWLKLKKDYLDGIGDTLDVIVIGGYKGQGKRAGLYGGYLLACYDPEQEVFQTLCRIGTGFSDEDLSKHTEFFKQHIISEPKSYYEYDKSHIPDDWFDAVCVWEIKGADLTLSPNHFTAKGQCSDDRGVSLRFPRFIRVREDKTVTDGTTAQQVAEMYLRQAAIQTMSKTKVTEDDFY